MSWKAAALFACAFILAPLAAAAQPAPAANPPYDPAVSRDMSARCNSACFKAADACLADPAIAPRPAVCDTRAVACFVSCAQCVQVYSACRTDAAKPGTPNACMLRHLTCSGDTEKAARERADLITFRGGDGSSIETAVVIGGARNENEGIVSQLYWAAMRHPDWRKNGQALLRKDGRAFDRIEYSAKDGPHRLYFDITGFFGKL
jgi:hypothetical protein